MSVCFSISSIGIGSSLGQTQNVQFGSRQISSYRRPAVNSGVCQKRSSLMSNRGVCMVASTSSPSQAFSSQTLEADEKWMENFDYEGFRSEVDALGKRLEAEQGIDDVKHLKKIQLWANVCLVFGVLTMWLPPNPVTMLALSTYTFAKWAIIAHHTCHGGYNRSDESRKYNSAGFATGSVLNRAKQWLDWMLPEAWNIEHNNLHHYRLGEIGDPDLVERNLSFLRNAKVPRFLKYITVFALIPVWKWFYYAPNTFKQLKMAELRRTEDHFKFPENYDVHKAYTVKDMFRDTIKKIVQIVKGTGSQDNVVVVRASEFIMRVLAPYFVLHFLVLPSPLLMLAPVFGTTLFFNAVWNLIGGELLTNAHAFLMIVTNHVGSDLYKFESSCRPRSSTFYLRQVLSSANYKTGSDFNDFWHGWLNYQVEHHMWPQLSALSYQKAQPELVEICKRYNVPYIQESVWTRLRKTLEVMVGAASMRQFPEFMNNASDTIVWPDSAIAVKADQGKDPTLGLKKEPALNTA